MRIRDDGTSVALWASALDTEDWATKPGAEWPCSTLRGRRFFAAFDTNGLCELTVDGDPGDDCADFDAHEFNAITSDLLADRLPEDHPCYFVTVGQFRAAT